MKQLRYLLTLIMLLPVVAVAADNNTADIDLDESVILIRHALAPGTGDPANFDVSDCSTQRNLSEQGREQAANIGAALKQLGVDDSVPVYTSEWCRCRETAELMNTGPVQSQPLLNSFFETPADGPAQLQKLGAWLQTAERPLILVTHQVVITGMTSVFPSSGEMVVATVNDSGELSVQTTIETAY
jgi:phosphohistidine phosphatase SixA